MANGFNSTGKRIPAVRAAGESAKLGSRRIFAPLFKLQVLDSYRNDADCKGNQRATARKYGIHRRQIQKWLQAEEALRGAAKGRGTRPSPAPPAELEPCAPVDLSLKRPISPPPAAWDLTWKAPSWPAPKPGYETEAPPPPPPAAPRSKPFRLFRPYLLDDNFEEVELPCPAGPAAQAAEPCGSAFERVTPSLSPPSPLAPLSPCPHSCTMSPGLGCCAQARQRQSYTVDFKLQTIRSYYQDAECRGNQRAVASKFGIHRRQVQKWLQQEDRLAGRTEPMALALVS